MRPLFLAFAALSIAAHPAAAESIAVPAPGAPVAPAWWEGLGDPDLALLVERALGANLDIEQAAARLDRAAAASRATRASLLPNSGVEASAAAIRQSLEDPQIRPFASLPGFPREQERYSAGLSASWEIDLFGGAFRRRSARANAQAAAADLAAARVAVAAEAATAWLTVRELQARRANLQAQRDALAGQEAIVGRRVAAGTAAPLDADRISAERARQAAGTALLDGLVTAEVERLGVLIADAQAARAMAARRAAEPFRLVAPPVDALQVSIAQRPDVVAADRRLEAADAGVSVARSLRFPRISLGGLLASVAYSPAVLFTGAAQSSQASAAVSLPLLDFGRIDAEIADAKGSRRAALAASRKVALEAAADVARSAAVLGSRRDEAAAQREALNALDSSRQRVGAAYAAGTVDLGTVLDVERSRLGAEDGLIVAQAETLKALVSVFRASAQLR
jgi:outer membrane protein TolC